MAATVTVSRQTVRNGELKSYGTLNVGVYTNPGGVAVTPGQFKLGDSGFDLQLGPTTTGHVPGYDKVNKKILVNTQGVIGGATAAAALANGALLLNDAGVEGASRQATTAASTTYKHGPLLEVTNAVDLTAIVFSFEATGAY